MAPRATWCSVLEAPTTGAGAPVAEDIRVAASELLQSEHPGARRIGAELSAWLSDGGDLQARLGARSPRGKRSMPQVQRMKARDAALRELAVSIDASPTERARRIADMARNRHPLVLAIHAEIAPVPTSPAQVARILRSTD